MKPAASLALGELLENISSTISARYKSGFWINAILTKAKVLESIAYIELMDSTNQSYQCTGIIRSKSKEGWSQFLQLFKKFGGFSHPVQLCCHVKVELSNSNGLQLNVDCFDLQTASYSQTHSIDTIKARLKEQGIIHDNLHLKKPVRYRSIAVIAPKNSAGLKDFQNDIDPIEEIGFVKVKYFYATFQGKEAGKSIVYLMRDIYRELQSNHSIYDCLVVLRGGGSASDLNWLNDFNLANAFCKFPIPILTGIGHASDRVILNEISQSFDTPSKVSRFIVDEIAQTYEHHKRQLLDFTQALASYISAETDLLNTKTLAGVDTFSNMARSRELNYSDVVRRYSVLWHFINAELSKFSYSELMFTILSKHFHSQESSLFLGSKKTLFASVTSLQDRFCYQNNETLTQVGHTLTHFNLRKWAGLNDATAATSYCLGKEFELASLSISCLSKLVVGLGIDSTIKRGYPVITDTVNNQTTYITDANQLCTGKEYQATFSDTQAYFKLINIESIE